MTKYYNLIWNHVQDETGHKLIHTLENQYSILYKIMWLPIYIFFMVDFQINYTPKTLR